MIWCYHRNRKMKLGKSQGQTNIAKMLKASPDQCSQLIAVLINIFKEGKVAKEWNNSYIMSLFKGKNSILDRGNYHGLKLTDDIVGSPPPMVWVFEIFRKKGGSNFFHKKGSFGNVGGGGGILKKGVSLILILTSPFQCYLSLSVLYVCVCVCFVYLHHFYQYSLLFYRKNFSLIASNQQIWL